MELLLLSWMKVFSTLGSYDLMITCRRRQFHPIFYALQLLLSFLSYRILFYIHYNIADCHKIISNQPILWPTSLCTTHSTRCKLQTLHSLAHTHCADADGDLVEPMSYTPLTLEHSV